MIESVGSLFPSFWATYLAHDTQIVILHLDAHGQIIWANDSFRRLLSIRDTLASEQQITSFLVSDSETLWRQIWPPQQQITVQLHFALADQMPQTLRCWLLPDEKQGPQHSATSSSAITAQASVAGGWLIGEIDVRELLDVQSAFIRLTNELTTLSNERASQAYALEQARQALERRNEELDAFAQIVSHDLKAPLRTFRVFTRILEERYDAMLDAEGRRYLELMSMAADRIHHQIEHLLHLARAGQMLAPEPNLSLDDLFGELRHDLSGLLAERHAELQSAQPLPHIWGDRQRLRGVLQNLIVNGLTYNDSPRPKVSIGVGSLNSAQVTLTITDNGIGIAEDEQAQIWLPFQRARSSAQHSGGAGLGLAFCRRVVEAHGGSIELTSREGEGTTVFLTLPRVAPTVHPTRRAWK